ncbi:general odorant-binding protein 99a-like [Culicoides brevitarsis]|uniref:general odorant-binding protein 99a-like n=1 Tax=Culicoides brevitarsis TaxID=469753 RepID=UPI00307BD050
MKVFILLFVVGFVAAEYKIKHFDDLMHYHDECATEHNIPADTLAKYKKQKYEDDHQTHCHIHCVAKKLGVFDDEHGMAIDNYVAQVVAANHETEEVVRPKIVHCAEEVEQYKADHCLWAFKGFFCTKAAGYEVIERKHRKGGHKKHDHDH